MQKVFTKTGRVMLGTLQWSVISISTAIILLFIILTHVSWMAKAVFGIILILLYYMLLKEQKNRIKRSLNTAGLMIAGVVSVWLSQRWAHTPDINGPDGVVGKGSIAMMEKIRLNGREEWIIVRGQDVTKPVLLFVSGGPVGSELGWVKRFNADLEKDFVVVVWEEPGGGKSYPAIDFKTVRLTDYYEDALALTVWLKNKFHVEKIFLAGHSWGSIPTVMVAKAHPELFYAVVNIGQMINTVKNDRYGYNLSLEAAKKANDDKIVATLKQNGPPPYGKNGFAKYTYYLGNKYGTNVLMQAEDKNHDYTKALYFHGFNIPEYGLLDRAYWFLGLIKGMNYIYSPLLDSLDLVKQVPKLEVPIYFACGRHDYNAWFKLTEEYVDTLEAPKKEIIWFEESGHDMNYSEPGKFVELMRRVKHECLETPLFKEKAEELKQ